MLSGKQSAFLKDRLFMHSYEKRPCVHSFTMQTSGKLRGVHFYIIRQNYSVHPVNIFCPRFLDGQRNLRQMAQAFRVCLSHPSLAPNVIFYLFHLRYADSGLQVSQPIVMTQFSMIKATVLTKGKIAQRASTLSVF